MIVRRLPPVAAFLAGAALVVSAGVASAQDEDQEPEPGEEATLEGTLVYRELPKDRSVEAYEGATFFLVDEEGDEAMLWATTDVPANTLARYTGVQVQVRAVWIPPQPPKPGEWAPSDADGGRLPRSGRWAVREVDPMVAVRVGTLRYVPIPKDRSIAAHEGVAFVLVRGEDDFDNLWATSTVPPNTLVKFVGKQVEVVGAWMPPHLPKPGEWGPTDPSGQPRPRSGRWAVQELRDVSSVNAPIGPGAMPARVEQVPADTRKVLTGTLTYQELPQSKSVEAYEGVTFFLKADQGGVEKLWATTLVPPNALAPFIGKRVEILGAWIPPRAPEPFESAPVGPDGKPLPRSGRWAVQSVKDLSPQPAVMPVPAPVRAPPAAPVRAPAPPTAPPSMFNPGGATIVTMGGNTREESRLVGTLEYRELGMARSVEAYHGVEFFLVRDGGPRENLAPTGVMPKPQLMRFVGKRIAVRGMRLDPMPPGPGVQAPKGPDGRPMLRAGRWEVTHVFDP